ncbi:isocitrate dehydrogenase subunit 1, mitochondrial precursor [Candida tropicalis MYA-3404]|uniref:Isocitrate dehydrogenase subunit 1, mitochondrial n=1 Tax=Candida tropicalis (strain ATCC MYA-3404 / T1) TaxID=294747 RepID=C5MBF4_CANTT|nr:isocitrate dehydrogenase subunit 1, mitochondrial precursor [Candida tropicalis MYA-3404]EER32971.1 isocitrate dehydrogenase subunit 1, mitochondrial precursor [Candida tropicalis MYA-3404]KAG4406799.1 hypothetical protein JTP64_004183 [Candida tropicalis]
MFQTRVFTFGVFSDQGKVNTIVDTFNTWNVFDQNQRSVNIQFFSQGNVQGFGRFTSRSIQDTFQTNLVSLQGFNGFVNTVVLTSFTFNTTDFNNFPINWNFLGFKDLFDRIGNFLTSTIPWNQGNSVSTTVFLW